MVDSWLMVNDWSVGWCIFIANVVHINDCFYWFFFNCAFKKCNHINDSNECEWWWQITIANASAVSSGFGTDSSFNSSFVMNCIAFSAWHFQQLIVWSLLVNIHDMECCVVLDNIESPRATSCSCFYIFTEKQFFDAINSWLIIG